VDECLEQQKSSEIAMVSLKKPYITFLVGTGESTIYLVGGAVTSCGKSSYKPTTVTTRRSSNMAMGDPRTIDGGF